MSQWSYAEIQRTLEGAHCLTGPAEAHGTLAGSLCTTVGYRLEDWLGEILPEARVSLMPPRELSDLFGETAGSLAGSEMALELMLPGDDRPLGERAEALGAWCQGFLYGLGSSPISDFERLPGPVGEVVRDLVQITQVGVEPDEADEAGESAYAELVEFVRVGAQLVFEELTPYREPPPPSCAGVLH